MKAVLFTIILALICLYNSSCRKHSVIAFNANLQAVYIPFKGLDPGTHVLTL